MHYQLGAARIDVLRAVNLSVAAGERVAITGPSGSGKTSLLLLLSGLERPASGRVAIDGTELGGMDADALADLRRDRIGIVFQSFHLLPSLSALDNVALPLQMANRPDAHERAAALLKEHRESIDRLDAILVYTLAERFKHTQAVGKLKAEHDLPPSDPNREAHQMARLEQLAREADLDPDLAKKFLTFIIGEVIRHHEKLQK